MASAYGAAEPLLDRVDDDKETTGPRLRRGVVFAFSLIATCGALGVAHVALGGAGAGALGRNAQLDGTDDGGPPTDDAPPTGTAGDDGPPTDDGPPSDDASSSTAPSDDTSSSAAPSDDSSGPSDNCLLYKIAWPSSDAVADMQKATAFTCEHVASPDTMCGTLSRCDVALPYAESECNFQLHWVEAPDVHDAAKNTTWWENYFKDLNGDMETWNAYMHNGLQLYVPNVGAIGQAMADEGIAFMTRTSGSSDEFKHIIYEVSGRIIEFIGENDGTTAPSPFDASECAYAHELNGLTKADMHAAWNASGAGVRSNGLQLPMLMRATMAASDPAKAAKALYEELGSEYDSYLKSNISSSDCEVYTVGFAQAKYVELTFVNNKLAPTGDISLRDYEDYIQDSHNRFVGTNDDKWDHWLDQHIGFYASYLSHVDKTQCELMTMVQEDIDELGWPMAHRTDTDCAAANSCTNHMYIATPHSSMTFEYNVDCVNTSKSFPSICLCDQWNNDLHFEEITGKQCLFPADDSLAPSDDVNSTSTNSSSGINQTIAAASAKVHMTGTEATHAKSSKTHGSH